MPNSSYTFMPILLKQYSCFGHGLKHVHVVWIYSSDYFLSLFLQFELSLFQALLLSTYVDSRYPVRITPPIKLTFSDDSLFL